MSTISIIIPTNKLHPYLGESIDSAINQTYQANEIILVNDGGGQAVVDFINNKYPNVIVVDLPTNVGPGQARNQGAKIATSEWIAFLDSDDIWQPEKLEKQIDFLNNNPNLAGTHCGLTSFNNEGDLSTYIDKPNILTKDNILVVGHMLPSAFVIKRNVFEDVNGYDERFYLAEDHDLVVKLVLGEFQIGFQPESLVQFRRAGQGNISSRWKDVFTGMTKLYFIRRELFVGYAGKRYFFTYFSLLCSQCAGKARPIPRKILQGCALFLKLWSSNK